MLGAVPMEIKNWKYNRLGVVILFLLYQNLILCSSLNEEGKEVGLCFVVLGQISRGSIETREIKSGCVCLFG